MDHHNHQHWLLVVLDPHLPRLRLHPLELQVGLLCIRHSGLHHPGHEYHQREPRSRAAPRYRW